MADLKHKTAEELAVGDVLVDWWGTDKRSCDARIARIESSTWYGPWGKTREAVTFWCEPVDPSVPDSPNVRLHGECQLSVGGRSLEIR